MARVCIRCWMLCRPCRTAAVNPRQLICAYHSAHKQEPQISASEKDWPQKSPHHKRKTCLVFFLEKMCEMAKVNNTKQRAIQKPWVRKRGNVQTPRKKMQTEIPKNLAPFRCVAIALSTLLTSRRWENCWIESCDSVLSSSLQSRLEINLEILARSSRSSKWANAATRVRVLPWLRFVGPPAINP